MKMGDLFCGAAGGWSLGMHQAGIQTVVACEKDEWRRNQFMRHFPKVRMYDDILTMTGRDIDGLDVLCGSPPCQDASAANSKGTGINGKETGLFKQIIRLIDESRDRPRWLCFENSPMLRTRGADWVLDALAAAKYACWPCVVGAVHAGAPHQRKRVWFIAADTLQPISKRRLTIRGRQRWPEEIAPNDGNAARQQIRRAGLTWTRHWNTWNGGFARYLRVGDGLSAAMARPLISAYGDAILPQIAFIIARTIQRIERSGYD